MVGNTVGYTKQNGLCCGCGVCKGICPTKCISWETKNGLYVPSINDSMCVNCGLCVSVCPGLSHSYEPRKTAKETVTGKVLASFNAWSKTPEVRHISASGGVVSTVVRSLLLSGKYDGAFCLDSFDYREQLKTKLFTARDIESCDMPKSRYLAVSHEDAVIYIKKNRDQRLIFIGTSCAVRGLQAVIKKLNLNREQYLFIGLFCDKIFNYNVLQYFENTYANGSTLKALHFKNKESGGWPGDMKFFPENDEPFYVSISERSKAKDYFMPERCLYCVDKLNVDADISLGDNYTDKNSSPLGSNSVIIRTRRGMDVWSEVSSQLEVYPVEITDIQKAQGIEARLNNLYFGKLKENRLRQTTQLNPGVQAEDNYREYERAWIDALKKIECGAQYHIAPHKLERRKKQESKRDSAFISFMKRTYYYLRRKLIK